jgi:hypothetical protein
VVYGDGLESRKINEMFVLTKAQDIASEWVTEMRLTHVLDAFPGANVEQIPDIIRAMNEDIEREAVGEVVFSKEARKEVSRQTTMMFKRRLQESLRTECCGVE